MRTEMKSRVLWGVVLTLIFVMVFVSTLAVVGAQLR